MGLSEEAEEEEGEEMTKKTEEPKLPPGWDEARIQWVADYYENQSDEEMLAEDEAAFEAPDAVVMPIPIGPIEAGRVSMAICLPDPHVG